MHTDEHDRWIEALALGERDALPHARELESCEVCARRLADWRGARDAVAAAGREMREVTEVARGLRDVPGAERIDATLAQLAASARPPARSRARWLLAAAAVAVVTAAWFAFARKPSGPRSDEPLSARRFDAMSPSGAVTSVERFTWSYPLAHGGWFVVQVRSEGDPVAAPILDSGPLRQAQWTPSQGELAALPPRFAWQVLAYDGSGSLELASPSPSVSR